MDTALLANDHGGLRSQSLRGFA